MKYLILAKSGGLDWRFDRPQVVKILENVSDEDARKQAQEIREKNATQFPDLEVSLFKGEFIPE